jgi:TetR/AcrR family transcriptional regulator, mexJK operon transcriptional repressor
MSTIEKQALPGKREQRKAERRELILDIAQQSFLEQGYDRTTMSGIAESMGGSKGTLWSYFDSKEALFTAVIDRAAAHFRTDLTGALDPQGKPEIGLRRFAENFIQKITSAEAIALHRIVVGESPRFPELGRIFYARAPEVTRELLAGYMANQMEAGALRKEDPMKAAGMFLSLCDGGHHKRVLWGVEPYSDTVAREEAAVAVEHFLRAYGVGG